MSMECFNVVDQKALGLWNMEQHHWLADGNWEYRKEEESVPAPCFIGD